MIETKIQDPKASVRRFAKRGVRYHKRRGAMLALIVLLLPMLLIVAALAINLAHIESTKTDIQIANDAAVRSAGRVYSLTGDRTMALRAAREAAAMNPVGNGTILAFEDSDLTIGTSTRATDDGLYDFIPSAEGNSVRLMTQSLADGDGMAVQPLLPVYGFQSEIRPLITSISTQADIDISIVIDRSGSMAYAADEEAVYPPFPAAAPDGWDFGMTVPPRSRWLDLVSAISVFREALNRSHQQELVSLSFYNDDANAVLNLTDDYSLLDGPLDAVSAQFDAGGTNIGGGMIRGLDVLLNSDAARSDAAKVIIVLTDGVHNSGSDPVQVAQSIADRGVVIFTITFSDEANEENMRRVAEIGHGSHFHAVTPDALQQAFIDISKQLPNLITK